MEMLRNKFLLVWLFVLHVNLGYAQSTHVYLDSVSFEGLKLNSSNKSLQQILGEPQKYSTYKYEDGEWEDGYEIIYNYVYDSLI